MRKFVAAGLMATALATAGTAKANLVIDATYDPSLSSSAITTINQAISFYESAITTNVTAHIDFTNMSSGLGESVTFTDSVAYSSYYNSLIASATSANDHTALVNTSGTANLAANATNPVTGSSSIVLKNPLARAMGFFAPVGTLSSADTGSLCNYTGDGCIGLNLAITNDPGKGTAGGYNLLSVVEHEIDEILGLGSALPNGGGSAPADPAPEDLFRFSAPGVRSFVTNNSVTDEACTGASKAYFSINGGTTNLASFNNCANGGDYGDWALNTGRVQDAYNTGGAPTLSLTSPELTALDVIGYTLSSSNNTNAPEPPVTILFGAAAASLLVLRRRARRV